jgi:hypothetical protein
LGARDGTALGACEGTALGACEGDALGACEADGGANGCATQSLLCDPNPASPANPEAAQLLTSDRWVFATTWFSLPAT